MKLSPIRVSQRPYVAAHPLALWFSIGVMLSGLVNLFAAHLVEQSVTTLALPGWLRLVFNVIWTVGGAASAFGIARGKPSAEAGGMTLLAAALCVFFLVIVSVRATAALSSVFIVALAVGCALRGHHLARRGYR